MALLAALALSAAIHSPSEAEALDVYQLGPGDKVSIRVVMWDSQELDFIEWTAISGSFSVSGEGLLSIPLAGTFTTSGKDLTALSNEISAGLAERVEMMEPPSVAIEIEEYRPFYVIGDVNSPGAFEATPGLDVLQAYALAGGAPNLRQTEFTDLRGVMRDAGDLSRIRHEQLRLRVLAHRLNAELSGAETFVLDQDLSHPDGPEALARLVADEAKIFAARREARALENQSLEELKVLLTTEIAQLETKRTRLEDQITSARDISDNLVDLGNRGLARADQLRNAQRVVFELESQDIDLENSIFRAQQRIKEADLDIIGIRTRLLTQVTAELQQVNAELEDRAQRADLLVSMLNLFGVGDPEQDRQYVAEFFLTRSAMGGVEEQVANNVKIGPGDLLRVQRQLVDSTTN